MIQSFHKPPSPIASLSRRMLLAAPAALACLLLSSCAGTRPVDEDRPSAATQVTAGPPKLMRQAGFSLQGNDAAVPTLPATLNFNASALTENQCRAWLTRMIPRLAFKGSESDFETTHNRVVIADAIFRQYRIFGGGAYPARTYQLRQMPLAALAPDGLSQVQHAPAYSHPSQEHWYFTVTANSRSPWQREWEVWDTAQHRVASRGTYQTETVTFRFATKQGAAQAAAVFTRMATLLNYSGS